MNSNWLSRIEVCLLMNVSESRLTKMIADGEFPAATHIRGNRHFWALNVVRRELANRVRPIARGVDRAGRMPQTAEARA